MTKQWMTLFLTPVLVFALAGCGGDAGDNADPPGETGADAAGPGDASAPAPDDVPAPESEVALVGRWEVLSQNGTLVREGELTFSFFADGGGMSLEGTSEKAFTWAYDAETKKLHIITGNEDLLFSAAMVGQTLTLVLSDPPTTLVLRPIPESSDVE